MATPFELSTCRRRTERNRCSLAAHAMLAGRWMACTITERSEHGFRIAFPLETSFDASFMVREQRTGQSWWVDLIWSGGLQAGVAFRKRGAA